jgi:hypothetical protein
MIEAAGWGAFFIWVGVAFLANVGWGVGLFGVGIIALGVQLVRSLLALKVDRRGLGFGSSLVVAGLVQWLDIPLDKVALPSWLVPAAFIVLGVAILVSGWARRHRR